MKLTTVEFRDFIHNYKSLPDQVLTSYDFTPDELPSDNRKKGFHQISKQYKACGMWLRYLLLLENECVIELKSSAWKDYRIFAHELKQWFELIRAIFLSEQIGKSYPKLIEEFNCEGFFYRTVWEACDSRLKDLGILGNKPKPLPSKARHYKLATFFCEYFDDPKPERIFQKNNAGKLVNAMSLENSVLDSRKFVLQDSVTPPQKLDYEIENSKDFSELIFYLGQTQDFYIGEAMRAYLKAAKRRARMVLGDAKFGTFAVNKDDSLGFSRSKKSKL